MRIAIDIDSTLHHYWDLLDRLAQERHGVALPYEEQRGWGITRLDQTDVEALVASTHDDEHVLAAEPYENAVETIAAWHADGHFIHITSHRRAESHAVTERWLRRIELPFDELYCSYDKVTRCVAIGIDVLIDDSPVNLERAHAEGITPATIVHPWNRELCERGDVVCAADWTALARELEPVLGRGA